MTLAPWLARALRRFVETAAMMIAGHEGMYRIHHARPALPPAHVNRVEVRTMEGSHTITDRAAVARIVALVRSDRGEWSRYPGAICLLGTPRISFYQGAVHRGTIVWGPRVIGVQTRHAISSRGLSPQDAAELQRLLER
jgi:hypothetical protein